ncbi:apolipoprotein N-acyltransferase [uncultured Pseudokineococcus sp.]|uniref:apolipoprotein N-acyltransferase n=1 Tax=uncultured Pseudokineococcus sp. TaxID=1642928 RepID=UPI00260D459B|nr:apolipoprotein N-acyltransferase [uncultured Pseudokineococcus sp.]
MAVDRRWPALHAQVAVSAGRSPVPGARGGPPLPVALVLAAVGGGMTWSAFPGAFGTGGVWPASVVGVCALVLATRGRRARAGLGVGLVFGLAFLVPHLAWSGTYVGLLPWVALATACAGFYAVLGAVMPFLQRLPAGWSIVAVTGGWVAIEAARARVPFGGFPWGRLAFSQVDSPAAGWAAVGGAPLVTAAVVAAGTALALAVLAAAAAAGTGRRAPSASPRSAVVASRAVVLTLTAVLVLAAGAMVPRPSAPQAGTAQVAAVQGNVPRPGLDFNAERRAVLDNHVQATLEYAREVQVGAAPRPDLVLWPENASDIDPYLDDKARRDIEATARAVQAPLLVGAVLDGPGEYLSNAGLVVTPAQGLEGATAAPGRSYVKRRPAPFGEYIPYRDFFRLFSDKVDLVARDFLPGTEGGVVVMGGVRVGDVICFEVAFDDLVRDSVRAGAQMLVVQTNNATFGYSDEAVQQLAMSRLRAIETGRAVVQISTVGVSSIVAPDGSAPVRTDLFTQAVLRGQVPLRTSQTLATRLGPVPEVVLGAGVLLPLVSRWSRRRRSHRQRGGSGRQP